MNTSLARLATRLAAALLLLPTFHLAAAPADHHVARALRERGSVPVESAGPYVQRGTFRIQVLAKFGRPDVELGDDTWLYYDCGVEETVAKGTLVVRFVAGRVSELALASPATVAALKAEARKRLGKDFLAVK